jgi:hypothetical protein
MDRDKAPGMDRHRKGRTPGDQATRGEGTADRAGRIDRSNARAAGRSLAANRNHVRHNARSMGSLRMAPDQPSELLPVERHTDKARRAAVELMRLGTAGRAWAPERS